LSELRVEWRMATWYQCAIMIAFAALFAWIVRMGLQSTGTGVWPHVLIPPYGLWVYATVATIVNRRRVVVTPKELVMTNGPLPVRGRVRIAREDVVCAYHSPTLTMGDSGDTVVLFHTSGIETRAGVHVQVFGTFNDIDSARLAAQRIAGAFGSVSGAPVEVRHLTNLSDDPGEKRTALIWLGITVAAFIAGFFWDLAIS
jgi:hypothetical protein